MQDTDASATRPSSDGGTPRRTPSASPPDSMEGIRTRLCSRAGLFDDPRAYRAGVADAVDAVVDVLATTRADSADAVIVLADGEGPPTRLAATMTDDGSPAPAHLDELHARLLSDARLFDDPRSYAAGVEDALHHVEHVLAPVRSSRAGDVQGGLEAAWVSAYAVGLAHSHHDDDHCSELLLAAAGGDRCLLEAARTRLAGPGTTGNQAVRRARRLVEASLAEPCRSRDDLEGRTTEDVRRAARTALEAR